MLDLGLQLSIQINLLSFCPLTRMNDLCQIRNKTPDLARGAAKAVLDLYEVVTHDLLSSDLRFVVCY